MAYVWMKYQTTWSENSAAQITASASALSVYARPMPIDKVLLDRIINLAAELNNTDASDLEKMLAHVEDKGTDHGDGAPVDELTMALIQVAIDEK